MRNIIFPILIFLLTVSCESWLGEQGMPMGRGEAGEIILVMDSVRWEGDIGKEIRLTFRETVDGLPREEPLFDLRHVEPLAFKGILQNAKNLVIAVPLNDNTQGAQKIRNLFTPESQDSLNRNGDIFMINRRNLYATGQQVLFIINRDDSTFRNNIVENRSKIRNFFNRTEERRAFEKLYKAREERMIANKLETDFGFSLRIPFGYRIAESSENFVWLRLPGQEIDKNIFVAFKEYTQADAFENEEIIAWRDEICRDHIYGDPEDPESYLSTEMLDPPILIEVNFNGKYAKKTVGRWKTNTVAMGGPFVSYIFVDEESNRLYYIEGFVYSPGVDQRELMREMNVILKTFQTEKEKDNA